MEYPILFFYGWAKIDEFINNYTIMLSRSPPSFVVMLEVIHVAHGISFTFIGLKQT